MRLADAADLEAVIDSAVAAARAWRDVPAPKRGDAVRRLAELLREHKDALGTLVALENGKIKAEGDGEVQEMIDIADFAVGQSRMLYGKIDCLRAAAAPHVGAMASARRRRRDHRVQFPRRRVGVERDARRGLRQRGRLEALAEDPAHRNRRPASRQSGDARRCGFRTSSRSPSATRRKRRRSPPIRASRWCRSPARPRSDARSPRRSPARFGKTLLECAGNNALVVAADADLELVVPAVLFGAVGTAGQRCTTTRRLIVHRSRAGRDRRGVEGAYAQVAIGDPLDPATLMGPLIDAAAVDNFEAAIAEARAAGGASRLRRTRLPGPGFWVEPTIITGATTTAASCSARRSRRSST